MFSREVETFDVETCEFKIEIETFAFKVVQQKIAVPSVCLFEKSNFYLSKHFAIYYLSHFWSWLRKYAIIWK